MTTIVASHTLTAEQCQIANFVPSGDVRQVLINAFAGCAKTTMMREIVKRWREVVASGLSVYHNQRAGHRFLYLVFNRDAERAARDAFYQQDGNASFVCVRTHHSLALKFYIEMLRAKVQLNQPVGKGVARALQRLEEKIAQLQGKQKSRAQHNDDYVTLDNDDGPPPHDDADDDQEAIMADDEKGFCYGQEVNVCEFPSLIEQENADDCYYIEADDENASDGNGGGGGGATLPLELENDQREPFKLGRGDAAVLALEEFCRDASDDAADQPNAKHVAFVEPERDTSLPLTAKQTQILARARKAWHDSVNGRVNSKNGRLIMSHEVTLKLFCASRAQSEAFIAQNYHTVLFDEAQDIDEILMRWIETATAFKSYLVGDGFQSIYSFKGALNAMDRLAVQVGHSNRHVKMFYLSRSFRFGSSICRLANAVLQHSGRFDAVQCTARLTSAGTMPDAKISYVSLGEHQAKRARSEQTPLRFDVAAEYVANLYRDNADASRPLQLTVIARTNVTLLKLAVQLASHNVFVTMNDKLIAGIRQGVCLLTFYNAERGGGVPQLLTNRLKQLSVTVSAGRNANLHQGLSATGDALKAASKKWFEFVKPQTGTQIPLTFANVGACICDQVITELQILQIVEFMGDLDKAKLVFNNLLKHYEQTQQAGDDGRRPALICATTLHGAKGGEWDHVLLMDDFTDLCTLIAALDWCHEPQNVALYRRLTTWHQVAKEQFRHALSNHLQTVIEQCEVRKNAIYSIERSLKTSKSFNAFLTALNEEIHIYYVAITRAKRELHHGVLMLRFLNKYRC